MDYELINTLDPNSALWQTVSERAKEDHKKIIVLSATPNFFGLVSASKLTGTTIVDHVTKRTYKKDGYRFWNDVPIPAGDKVEMFDDGSIFVKHGGVQIAREYVFPNTRRAVQDLRYLNPDGSLDYIVEFASDGSLFSNIFYAYGKIQEIDFFNDDERPVLRYYYYEGNLNFITIEDPNTGKVLHKYSQLADFFADQVASIVKPSDTVTISYMGIEMSSLRKNKAHNILQMIEPPFDNDHQVRGNLAAILKNDVDYIQTVKMPLNELEEIKHTNLSVKKIELG